MNAVRKHLSSLKGGGLARMLAGTPVVGLILSDVVGDDLDTIASGPLAPDRSTFAECRLVLERLGLWKRVPVRVRRRIEQGMSGCVDETPKPGTQFAILITGDGGWAELDRRLAQGLTRADVPVVGWDSRAYYWTRRTPEGAASDLARLIRRFGQEWRRPQVLLIGYSRGADVLPFLLNRLPEAARAALRLVALLGPGRTIDFEFHLADYVRDSKAAVYSNSPSLSAVFR